MNAKPTKKSAARKLARRSLTEAREGQIAAKLVESARKSGFSKGSW